MEELAGLVDILMVASHSEQLLTNFCNKGLYLDGGRVAYCGSLEVAFEKYNNSVASRLTT